MTQPGGLEDRHQYRIELLGQVDSSWLAWFGAVRVRIQDCPGGQCLSILEDIVADQAGLVGLIRHLHNLGVVLVSLQRVDMEDKT